MKNEQSLYRGVKDSRYRLVPTLGRLSAYRSATNRADVERGYLRRSHAANTPQDPNFNSSFGTATTAQHHGAPTRLLDWTESPLIAAYFACEPLCDSSGELLPSTTDAAIYAAHCCPDATLFAQGLTFPF